MNRARERARSWVPRAGLILLPLPAQLLARETLNVAELLLMFALLAGAGVLVSLRPRQMTVFASIVTLVLVADFFGGSPNTVEGWSLAGGEATNQPHGSGATVVTRDRPVSLHRRVWIPPTDETVTLLVENSQEGGAVARPAFYGSGTLEPGETDSVIFRSQPGTYVYMSHDIDGPAAGRSYVARAELRSVEGDDACGSLVMLIQGYRSMRAVPICVGRDWSTFEVSWEVPQHDGPRVLDVVLTGFGAANVAIRSVQAWEITGGRSEQAAGLRPGELTAVAIVRAAFGETGASSLPMVVEASRVEGSWAFVLEPSSSIGGRIVDVRIDVPPNSQLPMWSVTPRTDGGTVLRGAFSVPVAMTTSERRKYHFAHPNLAGHAIAAVAVAVAAVGAPGPYAISVVAGLAMLGAPTGSRIALAVSLFALLLVVARTVRLSRQRVTLLVLVLIVAASLVSIPFVAGRDARIGATPRSEVWKVAVLGIVDSPLIGQQVSFRTFAAALGAGPRSERVAHAHNLWLDHGFRYGAFAVVGLSLLFAALVRFFALRRRWEQALGVLLIAMLQVFDVSLFYAPVTIAFVLLVNGTKCPAHVPGRDEVGP